MIQRPALGGPQDLFRADRETVSLPVMTRAEGVYFWDEEGRRYLDVSSGPVVSNIGHCDERVARALYDQAMTLDFASSRQARHQPNIALAEQIARLAGPGFERVCLSSGGSEAVEIGLKFLRQYRLATGEGQRRAVISCLPSYHGSSIGTLAISGDDTYRPFLDGFAQIGAKLPAPISYRLPAGETAESYGRLCAEALDERILELGVENVLAFIIEPIGGLATGCVVPPLSYLEQVRAICDRHGVFLVFDEVLCGAGRTGKFLAAHRRPSVSPDLVILAKGLGAGYVPLGATLAPASLVDHLATLTGFGFTHTYSANPIMCAGALAVLDIYETQRLADRAVDVGAYLKAGLERLSKGCSIIGDIRGLGLLLAVEIVQARSTKTSFPSDVAIIDRIRSIGLNHGLLIYGRRTAGGRYGDWFMVSPPLIMTEEQCDDLLARLAATLDQVMKEVTDMASVRT